MKFGSEIYGYGRKTHLRSEKYGHKASFDYETTFWLAEISEWGEDYLQHTQIFRIEVILCTNGRDFCPRTGNEKNERGNSWQLMREQRKLFS